MQTVPNTYYRVSIKALILDEQQRFLLIRENNNLWELPGGGLDWGEKPHDCLRRELKEEMGLEVVSIALQPSYFVTAFNIDNKWKSSVLYVTVLKGMNFTPSEECEELRFFTKEETAPVKLYPIVSEFLKVFDIHNHITV